MDVIGLGTVAMDIMLQVDTLPKEDGFGVIKSMTYVPGGSGTNVITQLSRLNARCGYIAQTGDDALGADIRKSLLQEKIGIDAMPIKKGGVSLHTNIVVDDLGKKFILLNMGDAFLSMHSESVDFDYVTGAKVLYTDLLPGEPALAALKKAKRANVLTAFNMQVDLPTMEGFGVPKEVILESLEYVDVFAPCRDGLYSITGTQDLQACKDYLRKFFRGILLITLGSEGSVAFDREDRLLKTPIFDLTGKQVEVVDTTGAGDSYMGAFIYAYFLEGMALDKAMNFASACATYTCTKLGARSSPTRQEIDAFLQDG